MDKFKVSDRIKVVATSDQQLEIGIIGVDLKGKVGIVIDLYCDGGGMTVDFHKYGRWSMPSDYVDRVIE